jgi:hypothetical protein
LVLFFKKEPLACFPYPAGRNISTFNG